MEVFQAVAAGDLAKCQELVAANGAEIVTAREPQKQASPLHFAAALGHAEIMQFLISNGADVNAQSSSGDTPLHVAILKDQAEACKILIRSGCDPKLQNAKGKSGEDLLKDRAAKKKKGKKKAAAEAAPEAAPAPVPEPVAAAPEPVPAEDEEIEYVEEIVYVEEEEEEPEENLDDYLKQQKKKAAAKGSARAKGPAKKAPSSGTSSPAPVRRPGRFQSKYQVTTPKDEPSSSILQLRERLESQVKAFPPQNNTPRESSAPVIQVAVVLADESRKKIAVPEDYTGQELMDLYASKIGLTSNDLFELVVLNDEGKITRFIDADVPVSRQRITADTRLGMRAKFFKFPEGDGDPVTARLLFTQVQSDIVTGRLPVSESTAVRLAALQLQATYGDYDPKRHNEGFIDVDAFPKYLPPYLRSRYDIEFWEKRLFNVYARYKGQQREDAQRAYMDMAKTIPCFGSTFFEVRGKGGKKVNLAVAQDGMFVQNIKTNTYKYYSFFRASPSSNSGELRLWHTKADEPLKVEFTVLDPAAKNSSDVETMDFTAHDADNAREIVQLITGYYCLLIFGDCLASHPLVVQDNPPIPNEPLPLRTVFRPPFHRVPDVGYASQVDHLMDNYVKTLADNGPALIQSVLPAMAEAADSASICDTLVLNGAPWTAQQLDTLVTCLRSSVAFEAPSRNLRIANIQVGGVGVGDDDAKVESLERLLTLLGNASSVDSIDISDNNLKKESQWTSLKNGLMVCKPLAELIASGNDMGDKCFSVLLDSLKSQTVRTMRLSKNELGDNAAIELGRKLHFNATTTSVDLSNNKITDVGLDQGLIANLNSNNSLRTLNLSSNHLSARGIKTYLLPFIHTKSNVAGWLLGGAHISNKEMPAFKERLDANTLVELDLTGNSIGSGLKDLAESLANCRSIETLNLAETGLEKNGINALVQALPGNTSLKALSLRNSGISTDQAVAIVNALARHTTLTTLNLAQNSLRAAVAQAIATALPANIVLEAVNLSANRLGADGAVHIATAITACGFSALDISDNRFAAGIKDIARAVADPNTRLRKLVINSNAIFGELFTALLKGLEENRSLKEVIAKDNQKFHRAELRSIITPLAISCKITVDLVDA